LELSSELKYKKGESGAFLQLGELLNQKGDYDSSTKHFYRAMKIAEETGDNVQKEQAKVSFGMANASLKWGSHVEGILQHLDQSRVENEVGEEEEEEESENTKFPDIKERQKNL